MKTEKLKDSESGEDVNFIQELWPLIIVILLDFENVNSNRQINLKAGVYSDILMNKLDENLGTKKGLRSSKLTLFYLVVLL